VRCRPQVVEIEIHPDPKDCRQRLPQALPMFEAAEIGRTLSKDAYKRRVPAVRAALLPAQVELRSVPFP
jgi:hypothetical protein